MCLLCGDAAAGHAFAIVERPAHRLRGVTWRGSHAEAAGGAILPVIARLRAVSDASSDLWKSPIVGLSKAEGLERFSCFVGIDTQDDDAADGLEAVELPAARFVSTWHNGADGPAVERYGQMLEWMARNGIARAPAHCDQREEYRPDVDPAATLSLRLMIAAAASPGV